MKSLVFWKLSIYWKTLGPFGGHLWWSHFPKQKPKSGVACNGWIQKIVFYKKNKTPKQCHANTFSNNAIRLFQLLSSTQWNAIFSPDVNIAIQNKSGCRCAATLRPRCFLCRLWAVYAGCPWLGRRCGWSLYWHLPGHGGETHSD